MNHLVYPLIGELTLKLLRRSGEDVIHKGYVVWIMESSARCSLTESEKNLKMIYKVFPLQSFPSPILNENVFDFLTWLPFIFVFGRQWYWWWVKPLKTLWWSMWFWVGLTECFLEKHEPNCPPSLYNLPLPCKDFPWIWIRHWNFIILCCCHLLFCLT